MKRRKKRVPQDPSKNRTFTLFFDFHSFFFRSNSIQRRTTFIILLDSIFCLSISGSSILLIRSRKTFILDLIQQHHEYRLLSPGFLSFISFIKYYIIFYITLHNIFYITQYYYYYNYIIYYYIICILLLRLYIYTTTTNQLLEMKRFKQKT